MTAGNSNNTEEKTELLGNGSKPPLDDIPFDKPKRSWNKILAEWKAWLHTAEFYLYCSHALSAWGDRMWQFAVGLFLVDITPDSLRLTAIYGFTSGGAVLLFGAIVGDWIDKNPRLRVARTTLIIQNVAIIVCAIILCLMISFQEQIAGTWDGWLNTICETMLILTADIAYLASIGNTIAIERDWIVEICGHDSKALTQMSAVLRRIDLTTNILAPIGVGQVMTYGSMFIGAIFIASWNTVSMIIEYFLIWKVYVAEPKLATKTFEESYETVLDDEEETNGSYDVDGEENPLLRSHSHSFVISDEAELKKTKEKKRRVKKKTLLERLLGSFIVLYKGWKTYAKQRVVFAGLGLATLYMTVLGFDNITTGYAYTQGMTESILGGLMAAGAIVGIVGTFAFPRMRDVVGLERTGLFGFAAQNICLALCVVSVFSPGSSFDLSILWRTAAVNVNTTVTPSNLTLDGQSGSVGLEAVTTLATYIQRSPVSLILLMAGIVLARYGLWQADLTVTQMLIEDVAEHERGIVNGVQSSMNDLMNMLKFILVIVLPWPEVFGLLVIISYAFVTLGFLFYAIYSRQIRGHLFHFDRVYNEKLPHQPDAQIYYGTTA